MIDQRTLTVLDRRGELELEFGEGLERGYEARIKFSRSLIASVTCSRTGSSRS